MTTTKPAKRGCVMEAAAWVAFLRRWNGGLPMTTDQQDRLTDEELRQLILCRGRIVVHEGDVDHAGIVLALATELAAARAEITTLRTCSTCGGDPQSHPSGLFCVCGDGTRDGEVDGLRKSAFEARAETGGAQRQALIERNALARTSTDLADERITHEREVARLEQKLGRKDGELATAQVELDQIRPVYRVAQEIDGTGHLPGCRQARPTCSCGMGKLHLAIRAAEAKKP